MTITQSTQNSLFHRLGGSQGIAALVDTIVELHLANPAIKARYAPLASDAERFAVTKGHLRTFIEAGTGGPAEYTGRDMLETHRGMNVSETEYMAVIDDILGALRKHEIDEQSQKDMLAIAWSLKDEILKR
jgi:hemoglobin